jgi:RimJ/RimL family protein N-acetyltransferase
LTPSGVSLGADPYSAGADVAGRVAPAFRPVIDTARLVLRPLRDSYVDDIVAAIGEYDVAKMLARVPHPYTRDHAAAYIGFTRRSAAAQRSLILGVTIGDRLIGAVSLDAIPSRNRLGYWLVRDQWGHGYATEAVAAVIAYAFAALGVRQVRSGVCSSTTRHPSACSASSASVSSGAVMPAPLRGTSGLNIPLRC